jgi:2,4-dienoyl-CoA reductase-like NADH-dependent reductase (Old Yellow Enzyme family)
MAADFPLLMSPLKVGAKTIRNRVLVTGHIPGLEEQGHASAAFVAYHARRSRGGAGLQMTGTSGFHHTGHASSGRGIDLMQSGVENGLRQLADAVHEHGGTFLVQLGHSTATVDYSGIGKPLWAPSPVASQILKIMPREMTRADIKEVVAAYGAGAAKVRAAGLDGVEILAAFGYLPGAFFSPASNQRRDDYGGSVRNRVRFALQAAASVRAAVGPDLIVGMRISGDEKIDGGLGNEEMAEIATLLNDAGSLDYINVVAGSNNDRIMRWEHWPASPAPHGLFAPLAARIRAAVTVPVFVTGRVTDPALAEQILAQGEADMVGMTRSHIADPDIVAKIKAGEASRIRPCVGANVCINQAISGKAVRCFHNPEAARELEFAADKPAARPKRVVVIGAGPAGLEAARRAAAIGHQVTLYEASAELGGQLRLWSQSPFAREYALSIDWYEQELAQAQVSVKLNTRLGPDELNDIQADAAVLATGSAPIEPRELPGQSGSGVSVVTPATVLANTAGIGARHAVIADEGGGRNGLAAAEVLAEAGVRVTVVTGDPAVAEHVDGTVRTQLYRFLLNRGVEFRPMHTVTGLTEGKIISRNIYTGEVGEIADADLLVDWRGNRVVSDLEAALRSRFSQVEVIGDSLAPRTVHIATAEGAEAARRIG